MRYHKHHFDPPPPEAAQGDELYMCDPSGRIVLAVNLALATGRPLLVRGPTGCGKSSLARFVATTLGWRFEATTITSRTEARDLKWKFDAIQRLGDAQSHGLRGPISRPLSTRNYVRPGVLWWAFDPDGAARLPFGAQHDHQQRMIDSAVDDATVVLIDEIDKADPELPNDLLVPIEDGWFTVDDMPGHTVRRSPDRRILMVITTNRTRTLPAAFVRRCVVLDIDAPDANRLAAIGELYFPGAEPKWLRHIAQQVVACDTGPERSPSIAEFLDAVGACRDLGVGPDGDPATWRALLELAVSKRSGGEG